MTPQQSLLRRQIHASKELDQMLADTKRMTAEAEARIEISKIVLASRGMLNHE